MKSLLVLVLGIFFLSVAAPSAWAQTDPSSSKKAARRERVQQLIIMRLSSGLNLDAAEAQQLGNILKKHRQRKWQCKRDLKQLTAELRQKSAQGNEKEIKATLDQIQKMRDQIDRSAEEMFAEVKTMLSPQQLAQFVLIMDEIRHEVRAIRRRKPRLGTPGYQGPGPGYQPGYQYPAPPTKTLTDEVRVY